MELILNPLAVELAKLTLWLSTMAKSKPLSFLDHHLRVGNSLIGAKVDELDEIPKMKAKKGKYVDLSRAPVQLGLFQEAFNKSLYNLLQNRALIAQLPTDTLEDIHNKEKWELDFEQSIIRFRTLADLRVSIYFSNTVTWNGYNTLMENLQSPEFDWEQLIQKKSTQQAIEMGEDKRFFHWELEFPEVFYDVKGNRKINSGFDAIIGNPPYERTKYLIENQEVYDSLFVTAFGSYDIYVLFMEKAISLLNSNGNLGFITSNKYLVADYGIKLRQFLRDTCYVRELVDLTECPSTFPDVLISPIITFVSKQPQASVKIAVFKRDELSLVDSLSEALRPHRIQSMKMMISRLKFGLLKS